MRTSPYRIVSGRVDSTGNNPSGAGFTVRKNGTGVYELRIPLGSGRVIGVVATPSFGAVAGNAVRSIDVLPSGPNFYSVQTATGTPAALTDLAWSFVATVV